jgi:hypothetical protein
MNTHTGTFRLLAKNGRMEKSVEAHTGAITSLAWNYEGKGVCMCMCVYVCMCVSVCVCVCACVCV